MKSWFVLDHDVYTENYGCLTEYYDAAEVKARIDELEAENQKLREQRDAANAQIQMLNSVISGGVE